MLALLLPLLVAACARDMATDMGLVFAEPDEQRLKYTMYEPEDDGVRLRPAIVLIHGGGWRSGSRYQQRWYCNHFAHEGYVVMTIQYRMMPKYPFPNCVQDCKAAVRWLRRNAGQYRVDPDHIIAFGASSGGHLAGFLATARPEDGFEGTENMGVSSAVKAAVILYGAVDLRKYDDPPNKPFGFGYARRRFAAFVREDEAEDGEDAWAVASPITYVTPETCPVFLAHGTADFMVDYTQATDFHAELLKNNVPARLILFQGLSHGFDYIHPKLRRRMFRAMLAFLDEHAPYPGRQRSGE